MQYAVVMCTDEMEVSQVSTWMSQEVRIKGDRISGLYPQGIPHL